MEKSHFNYMVYTNKKLITRKNPKHTGQPDCKLPTHELFISGKKKTGEEFEIKCGAGWANKNAQGVYDGSVGYMLTNTNVSNSNGQTYSGYSLIKDTDIPSDQQAFQKAKTEYNNMDHIQ